MTTFTSDDREEEYKKIVSAAPYQPGYEDAVPIPFAGWVNTAPPHIVDSGASVMGMSANELADHLEKYFDSEPYTSEVTTMLRQQQAELTEAGHMIGVLREHISDLEKGLDSSLNLNKAQAERQVKELTDEEIDFIFFDLPSGHSIQEFARAILRKAQE